MERYRVEDGIDQEELLVPLLWRIYYDPLLDTIYQEIEGYKMEVSYEKKKTSVLLTRNTKDNRPCITYRGVEIEAISNKETCKILGCWFAKGPTDTFVSKKIQEEAEGATKKLKRARITEKQTVYIVNIVILAKLVYRVQNIVIPRMVAEKIIRQYTTVIKNKARLALTVPNSTINHYMIYGLKTVWKKQALQQIAMMHRQLNHAEFRNSTLMIRLQQIRNSANTNQSILEYEYYILMCKESKTVIAKMLEH
ncbi:reverse transcriptase [Gigaspora margarita]|uniref:Reverse transcriptase n=1 Tax=Gigaspora margarita TaxID=4874 RepID=A0A8H4AWR6_GIGMA|nr:reverse transcriptase [Gigaspora margarita]